MPVRLYAICTAEAQPPPSPGAAGEPLRMVREGGLAALVGDTEERRPVPSQAELWQHEEAVEQILGSGPVLPARFGQLLDDEDAVRTLMQERAGELLASLRRLDGAVELSVRAGLLAGPTGPAPATSGHESGRAYLQAVRDRGASLEQLRLRLRHALLPLAREHRERRPGLVPAAIIGAAYLVDRERVEEFRRRVATLDAELADGSIACTGPWPPYSFVEAERAAA